MKRRLFSSVLALLVLTAFVVSGTASVVADGVQAVQEATAQLRITKQPTDAFGALGSLVRTSVTAEGEGLKYQWYVKNVRDEAFAKSSITAATYTFTLSEAGAGRQVYCVVSDKHGQSVTSDTATFRVSNLKIVKQPASVGGPIGAALSASVVADGEGLTYQWYIKDVSSEAFAPCDATDSTYSLIMSEEVAGREAYCVVKDDTGNAIATEIVSFEIAGAISIVEQPADVYGVIGASVRTSIAAEGEGLKYTWYVKDITDTAFKKSSITAHVYSTTLTQTNAGRQLYCVVKDKYGNSITSDTVTFYASTLSITKQPQSVGAAAGSTVRVAITAEGEDLKYTWYVKDTTDTAFKKSSINSSTYTFTLSETNSGRRIYCVVTDANGYSVTSDVAVVEIADTLKILTQPQSVIVRAPSTVRASVDAVGEGLKYTWYVKNPGSDTFTKSSITTNTYVYQISADTSGRQAYCVVTDKYGNAATSDTATFSISNLKITKQPVNTSAAIGKNASVSIVAEGEGLKYTWYVKDPNKTSFNKSSITASSYTYQMTEEKSGRQIYCVVTDRYGASVQSQIAVMGTNAALNITKQPENAATPIGMVVSTAVEADGVGLTYRWYVKDPDADTFTESSIKSARYTYTMSENKNGRQVYCVITDNTGVTATTCTVTLSTVDPVAIVQQPTDFGGALGASVSTAVVAKGDDLRYQWYYKEAGQETFNRSTVTTATYAVELNKVRDGRQLYCVIIDRYGAKIQTDVVTLNVYSHYLTLDLGYDGKTAQRGVLTDNSYAIKDPVRPGYVFTGWVDEQGNPFDSVGTCANEARVTATWKLYGVSTLDELLSFTNQGVKTILITGDITVTEPIYISYNTTIYSDGDYSITRHPEYAGDIFVVGRDNTETPSVMLYRNASLTLGGGKGTLTVDGNRDNVTVDVHGALVFAGDSSTFNLYDGARLVNNKKISNERVQSYDYFMSESARLYVGGAAIVNILSTVNMYGGVVENNEVVSEQTYLPNEEGVLVARDANGYGGAIYNRGGFNMYGGVIRGNVGLRGGAIYNVNIARIVNGVIENNTSGTYGGAICSASYSTSDTYIGSTDDANAVVFRGNHSNRAGGVFYATTDGPLLIYGNTSFENNTTDSSGAAIYTAGTVVCDDAVFRGNVCKGSGGAIYHQYTSVNQTPRPLLLNNCHFEENSSVYGGAIIFSANDTVVAEGKGDRAEVTNCTFYNNVAVKTNGSNGLGGALYVTRCATVTVANCDFVGNSAQRVGGAVSIHAGAKLTLNDCDFTDNTAVTCGAVNIASDTTVKLTNLNFIGNKAVFTETGGGGNTGALAVSSDNVTYKNLTFTNNHADGNGGAMYITAVDVTLGADCEFVGNTAGGHGGAAYLTYTTTDDVRDGSVLTANNVLFKNNSAMAGGAISVRSACHTTLNGAQIIDNSATGDKQDASGGGALYVGFGSATLQNVTATGNRSGGYGGVFNAYSGVVTVTGGIFSTNQAPSGGAISASNSSTVVIGGTTLSANESTHVNDFNSDKGGGAIHAKGGVLTLTDTLLDSNKSDYYGGAVHANGTTVTINGGTVNNSIGGTGAALYLKGSCKTTVVGTAINDNTASRNGAVYANGGTVTLRNVTANGNEARDGGVIYTSGRTTVNAEDSVFKGNHATNGGVVFHTAGTTVNLTNSTFTENTAKFGGVTHGTKATLNLCDNTFTKNTANNNGGALFTEGSTITATGNNVFSENAATGHGGAIYVVYYDEETAEGEKTRTPGTLTMSDGAFDHNTAMGGGAISVRSVCSVSFDGTVFTENAASGFSNDNDGDGEGGGVVYVGFGDAIFKNVTATGNTAELGGVIDTYNADVTVIGGAFSNNKASSGGVIYAPGGNDVSISGATFTANESTDTTVNGTIGGGVVNIKGGTLTVTDAGFDGNKTAYYGGVINARGTTVSITGGEIKNTVGRTGAALYFRDSTKATVENTAINGNISNGNGVVYLNSGTLSLTDVTADGNKASNGGLLYTSGGKTTLTGVTASGNTATNNGGVLYVAGNATVTTTDGTFTANAAKKGGAIYTSENGKVIVNSGTLDANTATDGGAAYVTDKGSMTVNDTALTNNTVTASGNVYADAGSVTLSGVTASGNTAKNGGVVYACGTAAVTLTDSTFNTNSVSGNGGAVYVTEQPTVTISGCTFEGNTARNGGAVYDFCVDLCIADSTFTGNSSTNHGGAVYLAGATVTATGNNVFTENAAASHGGAVYVVYYDSADNGRIPGVFNMTGGSFSKNTALGGGAVSIRSVCTATFDGTVFTENAVSGFAGDNDGDG
ncbi:MAG: hypothetical protein IJB26_00400, partial [Clostridia bacterium]|nr:hypothetical protein [Clostridia bacterium]